jgi:phosphohistidine phosphatase
MLIFLVRHAPAVDPAGRLDEDRPLTPEGRFRMRRLVQLLQTETKERFDEIITSPFVRAVQTAEILAGVQGFFGAVETSRVLLPSSRPNETMALFAAGDKSLALIGHEPALSALASELLGRLVPSFKKGAIWLLEREGPLATAQLRWALQPKSGKVVRSFEELES